MKTTRRRRCLVRVSMGTRRRRVFFGNGDEMHISRSQIGKAIPGYGSINDLSLDDRVKGALLQPAVETNCLLSAIVSLLQDMHRTLNNIECVIDRSDESESDPSDGMLSAMQSSVATQRGDTVLSSEFISSFNLSVRARRAIRRSGIKYLSELTRDAMTGMRGCGHVTINEIISKLHGKESE